MKTTPFPYPFHHQNYETCRCGYCHDYREHRARLDAIDERIRVSQLKRKARAWDDFKKLSFLPRLWRAAMGNIQ